jgi:hypothetical protein
MAAIEVANPGLKGVLPKDYNRPALDKVMLGELIDLVSGIAMGEQGDKAKDVLGRVYEYFPLHYVRNGTVEYEALPVQAMVPLHPKEVPLCLTGTVSKICWRFYTGTLRRRLTRSHSIDGALSMAICQWDSKSTVWATGASSLRWWKVLEERKKFSMSTTTNTPTPRCVLCCPRWAVLVRRYSFLSVSSTLLDLRFSVTRKSRSRYALQGDLTLVVRHCWR